MFSFSCNHNHVNLSKQFVCNSSVQHVCWVWENEKDHKSVLVEYALEGFKNHEKVAIIHQVHTKDELLDYFSNEIAIETYLQSGQLVLIPADQVYCPPETGFVTEKVTETIQNFIQQALLEGYTKLRAYGDMSFAAKVDGHLITKYESELVEMFSTHQDHIVGLCAYPSFAMESSLIVSMMTCHPKLQIGMESFDTNFYFVPNGIQKLRTTEISLVVNQPVSTIAEYWISNLREREALLKALYEKNLELSKTNAILQGEIEERERAQIKKKMAEEANQTKRNFITTLSHEIRTPLFGILSMAALLRDTPLNDEQLELISMIDAVGEHIVTVLNDVLDYSKFETCKIELEEKPFSVQDCVHSVMEMYTKKKDTNRVSLSIKISDQVPAFVTGDVTRLRQILLNLIDNALKFTPNQGKVSITVDCGTANNGKLRLLFSVQDNGIGIPKEKFGRIFTEYQQADASTARLFGGTGLGLAISKKLVEAMNGQIWFESEVDVGTTFFFTININSHQDVLQNKTKKRTLEYQKCCSLQILVAEDNPINQTVIQRMLKKIGHDVDMACNGLEAVRMTRKKQYDLILMDFHMPLMNGPEAAREILAMGGSQRLAPRIVAVTASVFDEEKLECEQSGMDGFIQKPLRIEHLQQVCQETAVRCKQLKITCDQ